MDEPRLHTKYVEFFQEIRKVTKLDRLHQLAKRNKKTILLSESFDKRILTAAKRAADENIARILLVGNESEIISSLGHYNRENIDIVDPDRYDKIKDYTNELLEIRKDKGLKITEAEMLIRNPVYFGAMMVRMRDADGMVCGATMPSGDVLRAALQVVKCKHGTIVSSCIVMDVSKNKYIESKMWCLADCVLNIDPDSEQLASIAVSTSDTMKNLLGMEPKIAMLSFSTRGSSKHEFANKVAKATKIVQSKFPELLIDGEIQFDAAVIKNVSATKCPDSRIGGNANVLIFPDIQSGNIGYKIIERMGGGQFIGCITQGLNYPINDISRGCNSDDIVNSIAMTAIQAQTKMVSGDN